MNILFIAPYVPSRIRVRPFHLIKELSKRHQVTVVALGETDGRKVEGADELPDIVNDLHIVPHSKLRGLSQSLIALPTPIPMCAAFCWSQAMKRTISRIMRRSKFDIVHIEHLRAAHFASVMGNVPVVFDSVDCLTSLFRQMASERRNPISKLVMLEEEIKLRRYEPRVLQQFARVVITANTERDELLAMNPCLRVDVIGNGVDTDYFAPLGTSRSSKRIIFSGKMGYSPNAQAAAWFAKECFPIVRSKHSDAEFIIAGSGPSTDIMSLSAMPGITVTGYVPDIRPYLDSAQVAVAPMQVAVGIQNKVLEAMAMELPVVATPIALRAFGDDCPGTICAQSADQTAKEVIRLLDNSESARDIGCTGRHEVIKRFSWMSSVRNLEQIYEEVVANGGNR
ncbi:glycosyltransferase [bacterium]|nr:glycosyltransferase [bacterium]